MEWTATLSPGTRLGRYEITSFVAAGGMGEVYHAKAPSLDRDIAIRVLPVHVAADAERRARFEREARMAAGLNHPGIVTVHSVEQDGDRMFITMELVKGRSLAGSRRGGQTPRGFTALPPLDSLNDAQPTPSACRRS